ncbi:MAG: YggS family pyridoxal phosphate-dependent enzyme [Gemmataceae bacterium]|nr:YggS family pyridoxal phosphate-dependent enzyme [Gemmataceae bacterium]
MTSLARQLETVEARLQAACRRAGRPRADVTLVAVTKSVGADVAAELVRLGVAELGESRPQELWRKAAALPPAVHWHLIGHVQRNKLARTLPLVRLIHSVDSLRLLASLEEEAVRQQRVVEVLLEVNASGEANKHGFAPAEVDTVLAPAADLKHVRIRGLMTLAALADDAEAARPTFAALRQLRDRLRPRLGPPHALEHLSMGMSNDFEVAVEEGATLVRLGTVLFEGGPT